MSNHVNLTQQLQYYHYFRRLQHKRHLTVSVLIPANCNPAALSILFEAVTLAVPSYLSQS